VASCRGDEWLAHPGTVGRGSSTEIRILDPDGRRALEPGEVGEIFLRSTAGFVAAGATAFEYVNAPPPPRTDDGFTSIGDLGWLDEDGYLFIADRRVDMIVTGGVNVFPAEVEAALTEHPGVADAVVIGLADREWGRRVHAIVSLDPSPAGDGLDPIRLMAHCRERLSGPKVPKSIEIVDRLPRTEAGKLNRQDLAAERDTEHVAARVDATPPPPTSTCH
jgi:bile acid-coenzyme A ligase